MRLFAAVRLSVGLALPVQRIGKPPFFENLFCKVSVHRVFTAGHIFQEGDDRSFLFCCERSEAWRLPIRRSQIMEQSFNRHLRIVHVPERIVDQMGQVVPPRSRVEISKTPESVCLKVRICQFVENWIRWWCDVIAILRVATAQCHPGGGESIGSKCLAGSAADLRTYPCFFHTMRIAASRPKHVIREIKRRPSNQRPPLIAPAGERYQGTMQIEQITCFGRAWICSVHGLDNTAGKS